MAKRIRDGKPRKSRLNAGETKPMFLSEKLVAQLQAAVSAAQRKRMSEPVDTCEGNQTQLEKP